MTDLHLVGPLKIEQWRSIWPFIELSDLSDQDKRDLEYTIKTAMGMNQFELWLPDYVIKELELSLDENWWL